MNTSAGRRLVHSGQGEHDRDGFGAASIEAWPAAGGGLLVGAAEPAFVGDAPLRRAIKTIFLRIDSNEIAALTLPYVALEDEARGCMRALVAAELSLSEHRIEVRGADNTSAPTARHGAHHRIVDIAPHAEHSLQACAAGARMLLLSAAADAWGLPVALCRVAEGYVFGGDRAAGYGVIAADAALCRLPRSLRLRSGRADTKVSPIPMGKCLADG
ncbi:MAG TPA: hypothetical protein VMW18_08115 [Candidatus Binatia bacterium]|nr:hypothetical protein [Candidatus Binatia bacterium]